jgi:hypothetical protein
MAAADGARLERLTLSTGKTYTKASIAARLGISLSRAQAAIDHCKEQRVVKLNPYLCIWENGGWTYGYRHTVVELREFLLKEAKYMRTRATTNASVLEHALATKATLSKSLSAKQRGYLSSERTFYLGVMNAMDTVVNELETKLLAP